MLSLFQRKKVPTPTEATPLKEASFHDAAAKSILQKIQQEFGLDYSKQEYITMRKIERFARHHEMFSFETLLAVLQESATMKEKLVNMLTVGETYFYREIGHVKILCHLMKERRIKTILCAPSSSGEEAYSILLYLKEHYSDDVDIRLVGIDVNSDSIALANAACYSKRSTSLLPPNMLQNYFEYDNERYRLHRYIAERATFRRENIFDEALFSLGTFDVVFCRNMLIYFNDAEKKEVLRRLHLLLNPQGVLFLGHADISFEPDGFVKQIHSDGNYWIKR